MATERQIDANRRNATKSTGPKTAEGKARSSLNAITHGFTSATIEGEIRRSRAFRTRRDEWATELRPRGSFGRFALNRAVAASFRIEGLEVELDKRVDSEVSRAKLDWDETRRAEATDELARLARRPMVGLATLRSTLQGAQVLIEAWERLAEGLDDGSPEWTEDEHAEALDLLGVPRAARDRLGPLDPPEGVSHLEHRRDVVVARVNELKARIRDVLRPLDELERRQAGDARIALYSPAARRLHRYEQAAYRHYYASLAAVKARSDEAEPDRPPIAEIAEDEFETDEAEAVEVAQAEPIETRDEADEPEAAEEEVEDDSDEEGVDPNFAIRAGLLTELLNLPTGALANMPNRHQRRRAEAIDRRS